MRVVCFLSLSLSFPLPLCFSNVKCFPNNCMLITILYKNGPHSRLFSLKKRVLFNNAYEKRCFLSWKINCHFTIFFLSLVSLFQNINKPNSIYYYKLLIWRRDELFMCVCACMLKLKKNNNYEEYRKVIECFRVLLEEVNLNKIKALSW